MSSPFMLNACISSAHIMVSSLGVVEPTNTAVTRTTEITFIGMSHPKFLMSHLSVSLICFKLDLN